MIKGMFKFIFGLLRLAIFLLLLLVIFHGWVIKQAVILSLGYQLGADVSVQSVKMDWKNSGFEIQGLEIGNPYDFPKGTLARIPLLIVSVDLPSIPKGVFRLKALGIDLREMQVINASRKGLNILALKPLQKSAEEQKSSSEKAVMAQIRKRAPELIIDELILSVGEISYLDTSGPALRRNSYQAGIRGATYYDIRGIQDVVAIVVQEVLKKMGMGYLETQFEKFQSRSIPTAAKKSGLFSKVMATLRGE
ncbi:MAG: hypothetical protein V1882_04220 [Candidatus Omnitrophota bacterium]